MNRTTSTYGPLGAKTLRTVLVLGTLASLGLPALAASGSTTAQAPRPGTQQNAQPNTRQQPGRTQADQGQRPAMQVRYYDADPLRGGKLLGTVTLQPPTRQAGTPNAGRTPTAGAQRTNPLVAQAPKGAKFAVISGPRGDSRVIDLSQAQDSPAMRGGQRDGDRGPGGRGPGEPGGQDGPADPAGTPGT